MNLLRNTPNILKANFAFQELFHFWWCQICSIITWAIRPHAQFPWKTIWQKKSPVWGPYASSDRGRKTLAALLEKGVRNEANAAMNAFSLRQKNSKTQRSYDKILIDLVRSGRTWRYLVVSLDARASLRYSRSVRPDLEPNIFPSSPDTQSKSTYNSRRNTNLKNFTSRIPWLPDIYESIDLG